MFPLVRRPDGEVLTQPFEIHPEAVVLHLDLRIADCHVHFGRVGIVGVVHQLADELDALRIEALPDGDQVALVDADRQGVGFHQRAYTAPMAGHPGACRHSPGIRARRIPTKRLRIWPLRNQRSYLSE